MKPETTDSFQRVAESEATNQPRIHLRLSVEPVRRPLAGGDMICLRTDASLGEANYTTTSIPRVIWRVDQSRKVKTETGPMGTLKRDTRYGTLKDPVTFIVARVCSGRLEADSVFKGRINCEFSPAMCRVTLHCRLVYNRKYISVICRPIISNHNTPTGHHTQINGKLMLLPFLDTDVNTVVQGKKREVTCLR